MPYDAGSAIAMEARRAHGLVDSAVDGVELVVGRELLLNLRAVVFEDGEMPQEAQETVLLKDATNEDRQLGVDAGAELLAFDRAPRHEALDVGGQRTQTGSHP